MKKRKLADYIAGAVLIFMLIGGLSAQIWGTAVRVPLSYGTDADSIRLWITLINDTTRVDSMLITSLPIDTHIVLEDTSLWRGSSWYYFPGDGATWSAGSWIIDVTGWTGPGTELYTVTYLIEDTAGSPIANASVAFYNWGLDNLIRSAYTNENGIATIGTNADSVAVIAAGPMYGFPTTYDSVTYSANYTDTIAGTLQVMTAAATANYVRAYIDIASGFVDSASGLMVPVTKVELMLTLTGVPRIIGGGWAYVPRPTWRKPNSSGRISWFIPANTFLTPGSFWELTYRVKEGYSLMEGTIKNFIVDTIPDPINILNATEVSGN